MIRTQIQLTEQQWRALKELSLEMNVSKAELVRRAVDALLKDRTRITPRQRRERALAALGRFRSDSSDVSEEHDRYLAEVYGQWKSS